jgi:hypothetical protein
VGAADEQAVRARPLGNLASRSANVLLLAPAGPSTVTRQSILGTSLTGA